MERPYRLEYVEDSRQNRLTVDYSTDSLVSLVSQVTDSAGRRLVFTYGKVDLSQKDRLIGVSLRDRDADGTAVETWYRVTTPDDGALDSSIDPAADRKAILAGLTSAAGFFRTELAKRLTGQTHQVLGEDVGAFVVCKPGVVLDEETLTAFCAERLADYKRPRHLWFVTELPRNATGKVMKHKLREEAAN